jgi:hypothetical protein
MSPEKREGLQTGYTVNKHNRERSCSIIMYDNSCLLIGDSEKISSFFVKAILSYDRVLYGLVCPLLIYSLSSKKNRRQLFEY